MTAPQPSPVVASQPSPPSVAPQGNGFAVSSLVLSIFGIVVGIIPLFIGLVLSFVPCVLGITFGIIGIVRSRSLPGGRGFGMALAGLVIASVNFLLYFVGYGIVW